MNKNNLSAVKKLQELAEKNATESQDRLAEILKDPNIYGYSGALEAIMQFTENSQIQATKQLADLMRITIRIDLSDQVGDQRDAGSSHDLLRRFMIPDGEKELIVDIVPQSSMRKTMLGLREKYGDRLSGIVDSVLSSNPSMSREALDKLVSGDLQDQPVDSPGAVLVSNTESPSELGLLFSMAKIVILGMLSVIEKKDEKGGK